MINFQRKDCQTVNSPCRTFGVNSCRGQSLNIFVFCQKIAVNTLHEIGACLIAAIYSAFYFERGDRFYFRVAYYVLQMPLHRINPFLCVEFILYVALGIRVVHCGIYIIRLMIVCYRLTKNVSANFSESHTFKSFTFLLMAKVMFFH